MTLDDKMDIYDLAISELHLMGDFVFETRKGGNATEIKWIQDIGEYAVTTVRGDLVFVPYRATLWSGRG